MKKIVLIVSIGILVTACSSSKNTIIQEPKSAIAVEKEVEEITKPIYVNQKINTIIQNHLGVSISTIARSKITETQTGYQWKFINVKTGEKFIGNSNLDFQNIEIVKSKS